MPRLNQPLTNKCIVLDIDESLVHTFDDSNVPYDLNIYSKAEYLPLRRKIYHFNIDDVVTRSGEGEVAEICGITRPGLHDFLRFCFDYFSVVAVWSAGKPKYVESLVDFMFKDIADPHIIYTYDHCTEGSNGFLEKPLEKMIQQHTADMGMSLKNTFALDDRETTFIERNPDNGVLIPEYSPEMTIEGLSKDDDNLTKFMKWLMKPEVIRSQDVRLLNKKNIFT